ncbi:MAG: ABC transporter ATP-binding protein [Acidimicrobiales bacterium]
MATAIEIRDVSKRFRLYQEKYTSLKERLLHAGRVPHHDFYALKRVSLSIEQGETLGILGRNGCGKSTLLKCIAGILKPTEGNILIRGHLAAMLELGAGFQPELSGRDNIYLNASLLGMSRRDVDKSFDEIVAFAELEEFIDNQVRFYSSGMYVRLGFAVAVNVNPDVLLVDEVLAVGDERFQQKCMQRIHDFQREGRTIVVVSHAADVMRQLCNRVAVINAGELVTVDAPGAAIRSFRDVLLATGEPSGSIPLSELPAEQQPEPTGPVRFGADRRVKLLAARCDPPAPGRTNLYPGESAMIAVELEVTETLDDVALGCAVFAANGGLIFDSESDNHKLPAGRSTVLFRFSSLPLLDGSFSVNVRVQDAGGGAVHARMEPAVTFEVVNPGTSTGVIAMPLTVEVVPGGYGTRFGERIAT